MQFFLPIALLIFLMHIDPTERWIGIDLSKSNKTSGSPKPSRPARETTPNNSGHISLASKVGPIRETQRGRLFILAGTGGGLRLAILLTQVVIFAGETLGLLLKSLDITVALFDLLV